MRCGIRLFATAQMLRVLFYLMALLALSAAGVRWSFPPPSFTLGEGVLALFKISSAHRLLSWRLEAMTHLGCSV